MYLEAKYDPHTSQYQILALNVFISYYSNSQKKYLQLYVFNILFEIVGGIYITIALFIKIKPRANVAFPNHRTNKW